LTGHELARNHASGALLGGGTFRDFLPQMGVMVGYAVSVVGELGNRQHKANRNALPDCI
jgi:hypothetical protein